MSDYSISIDIELFDKLANGITQGVAFDPPYSGNGTEADLGFRVAFDKFTRYSFVDENDFKVYRPQDSEKSERIFIKNIPLATAILFTQLGLAADPTNQPLKVGSYPFFVATDDKDADVPAGWPDSIKYSDDDLSKSTPLQMTFEEWGIAINNKHKTFVDADDDDTTKFVIGDLGRYGLAFAKSAQDDGFELIDEATYRTLGAV